jgi:large subunit ribosomal protein L41
MMARLRLTTKQVNGGYYKGNRTGSMGYFAKNGSYIIDWKKVRTYNVPENLADFKVCYLPLPICDIIFAELGLIRVEIQLTPFVTKLMPPTKSKYFKEIQRNGRTVSVEKGFQAEDYLELWASDNGPEVLEYERKDQRRAEYARARQEYERQKAERAGPSEQGAGTP